MSDQTDTPPSPAQPDVDTDAGAPAPPNSGGRLGGITGKGFMPGQSGNPKGRPKKRTLAEDVCAILAEFPAGGEIDKQEGLARIWIDEILRNRNFRALKALIDRLYPVPRPRSEPQPEPTPKIIILPPTDDPDLIGPGEIPCSLASDQVYIDAAASGDEISDDVAAIPACAGPDGQGDTLDGDHTSTAPPDREPTDCDRRTEDVGPLTVRRIAKPDVWS